MSDDPPPSNPVRSGAPDSGDGITLFCPHCDYNLTGLPENRCPECGEPFDPEELLSRLRRYREPIGGVVYTACVLGPAVILFPVGVLLTACGLTSWIRIWIVIHMTLWTVCFTLRIAVVISRRMHVQAAEEEGRNPLVPPSRLRTAAVMLLLLILQVFALAVVLPFLGLSLAP